MATDFTLPELGENISAGDVLRVLVKPGDTIEKEQAVLELETDKATIEVPSSVAGLVKEVKVKAGDKVSQGTVIALVETADAGSEKPAAPAEKPAAAKAEAPAPKAEPWRSSRPWARSTTGTWRCSQPRARSAMSSSPRSS